MVKKRLRKTWHDYNRNKCHLIEIIKDGETEKINAAGN